MTQPIKLEIDLDLDKYLVQFRGYDSGGDEIVAAQTLEEVVLEAAARQIVAGVPHEARSGLAQRITEIRREVIRDALAPIIRDALAEPLRRTNTYGEPVGTETTTLRDLIVKEAQTWLTTSSNQSSSNRSLTNVGAIIRDEVTSVMKKELSEEIAAAKAQVRLAVHDSAATVIADVVTQMAVKG